MAPEGPSRELMVGAEIASPTRALCLGREIFASMDIQQIASCTLLSPPLVEGGVTVTRIHGTARSRQRWMVSADGQRPVVARSPIRVLATVRVMARRVACPGAADPLFDGSGPAPGSGPRAAPVGDLVPDRDDDPGAGRIGNVAGAPPSQDPMDDPDDSDVGDGGDRVTPESAGPTSPALGPAFDSASSLSLLERRVAECARRWYRYGSESELASAVLEYEGLLRQLGQIADPRGDRRA